MIPCASAQYPVKPIRVIVPFAAGGPNDLLARLVGQKLTESWGQPVVIENRGGAGGTVGMEEVLSKLPPDGYALGMGGSSNLAVAVTLYEKLPYDPVKDFTPVINVATGAYALAVNPTVPAKNVKGLIAIAASKPNYLSTARPARATSSNASRCSRRSACRKPKCCTCPTKAPRPRSWTS